MNRSLRICAIAALLSAGMSSPSFAQGSTPASQAQQVLTAAAGQKYTFLVFFKDNGPATQAMSQTVKRGVAQRGEQASLAFVNAASPAEKPLVDRFNVSRAPMPLTVVVAPNGAITGLCPKTISDQQIAKAFVSPGAAACIKSMQEGKLVLACVQPTDQPSVPLGVHDFSNDPQFKQRTAVTMIQASDPAEANFLKQLEVDTTATTPTTVFLAPPGVVVGRFAVTATKDEMAAALHKAGKCCDDPNCKHNHAASPASPPAAGASRPATPAPRRN